jgi:phenylalanyl-tRNA synthetase beta chain
MYPDGTVNLTPVLTARHTTAHASYIGSCTGLALSPTAPAVLLSHMSLTASAGTGGNPLAVAIQYGQA